MKKNFKYLFVAFAWCIIIACFIIALVACDKRTDFFNKQHKETAVELRLLNAHSKESATIDTAAKTVVDTVKIGFNYLFEFQLTDKYPVKVQADTQGELYLKINGYYVPFETTELTSGTFGFNWIPDNGEGDYDFSLIFTDAFGNATTYKFHIHVFFNRKPMMNWLLVPVGEKSDLHYRFELPFADADALYGGEILYYQIAVNQDTTLYQDAHMDYVFPNEGLYSIGVRAFDSNDEWSNFNQISNYMIEKIDNENY